MNPNIGMVKDVLLFDRPGHPFFKNVKDQFQKLIRDKFASIIAQVQQTDKALYQKGLLQTERLCNFQSSEKLFSAPEFIGKIMEHPNETAADIYNFYASSAEAEIARQTGTFNQLAHPYLWTADGDYFIRYDKESAVYNDYNAFTLHDNIILDFFSPNCIRIDSRELGDDPSVVIEEYNYEEAFIIYEKLAELLHPLSTLPNSAINLVTSFTRTIILKKQETTGKKMFSSASLYPYIGRSLLLNAGKASDSQVIDALVHESIHSMLYSIDALNKWMPPNATIKLIGSVIISPWTGRALSLGNLCQAIFVWYGLFNFWQLAIQYSLYDRDYGQKRMAQIQDGFARVDIRVLSDTYNLRLQETFVQTVEDVKSIVLKSACCKLPIYTIQNSL